MDVYTVQLGPNTNLAWELQIPVLDTSVQTGSHVFAPTWRMEIDIKSGALSQQEYIRQYYEMMDVSVQQHPTEWEELLNKPTVAIAGTAPPGDFCHRHLLVNVIDRLLRERGGVVSRMGELE